MSDLDQYRTLYVAEAREYHENVVKNLLILENGPDQNAIAEIFRSAHSLKGMSASMEYKDMERLCHTMEDVFSLIRNGELFVNQSLMDVLLETTDAIEHMIDDIESGEKGLDLDLDYHVQSLQDWLGHVEISPDSVKPVSEILSVVDIPITKDSENNINNNESIVVEGKERYIVHIELSSECDNKNLRGMLILQNLNDFGQIISINPEQAVIEDGLFLGTIDLEIASDSDPDITFKQPTGNEC